MEIKNHIAMWILRLKHPVHAFLSFPRIIKRLLHSFLTKDQDHKDMRPSFCPSSTENEIRFQATKSISRIKAAFAES